MRKIGIYMLAGLLLLCMGCNDWLDVRPKSQVKEGDLFQSASGFQDALTGIYVLMGRTSTYGGNSTMGFMDMLAQTYSSVPAEYDAVLTYNYRDEAVKTKVDTMWNSNYYAIANCNYLLKNIAEHGDVMGNDLRALVEGEALALRAFLHFDLLRGYAPSYKMGKDDLAIPYQEKKGETKFRIFYNDGFARQEPNKDATCDNLPNTFVLPFPTLAERLMEHKCELCGATNVKTVMYQVRKLKGIPLNTEWHRIMIKKWRKTLAVCEHCNAKIHEHDK